MHVKYAYTLFITHLREREQGSKIKSPTPFHIPVSRSWGVVLDPCDQKLVLIPPDLTSTGLGKHYSPHWHPQWMAKPGSLCLATAY